MMLEQAKQEWEHLASGPMWTKYAALRGALNRDLEERLSTLERIFRA
jgi:hypothetical protein